MRWASLGSTIQLSSDDPPGKAEKGRSAMDRQDLSKEAKSLSMPWEEQYGYSQAVKAGDTIYLSGQMGEDQGE